MMTQKVCKRCGGLKNLDAFPVDKRLIGGHSGVCRQCTNHRCRERYKEDPLKYKERSKVWKRAHLKETKKYNKKYNSTHKEHIKKLHRDYYCLNRGKLVAYSKAYFERHKEEVRTKRRIYRDSHKKEISKYNKRYRERKKLVK